MPHVIDLFDELIIFLPERHFGCLDVYNFCIPVTNEIYLEKLGRISHISFKAGNFVRLYFFCRPHLHDSLQFYTFPDKLPAFVKKDLTSFCK